MPALLMHTRGTPKDMLERTDYTNTTAGDGDGDGGGDGGEGGAGAAPGDAAARLYAWRGRSDDGMHTLPSGLDDYPRGVRPVPGADAHVDLLAWMALAARLLADVAADVAPRHAPAFARDARVLVASLEHHWHDRIGCYADRGAEVDRSKAVDPRRGPSRFLQNKNFFQIGTHGHCAQLRPGPGPHSR